MLFVQVRDLCWPCGRGIIEPLFERSLRRTGPLLFDASGLPPVPSQPVAPANPTPRTDDEFYWTLSEGPASDATVALLLRTEPESLSRSMAVSATIGTEKAIRLLQARGIRFTAAAVGTRPPQREIDEAADEISPGLDQHPQTTAAKVATARGLARRLPTTLARLAAGELSLHQATRIEHTLRDLDHATAQAVEADAVPGNPRRLWHRLETALARHAPDHVQDRDQKKRAHREAYYWSDPADGTAGIGIQGPLELIAQLKAAIDITARPRTAGDDRPFGTRRFDVLYNGARRTLGLAPPAAHQPGPTVPQPDRQPPRST
ncbi:MAG: hypothetical protein QOC80_1918, partial [Frankiaceae bacterium]|nr:hypothetical protein [Frankiaceae bacterium]